MTDINAKIDWQPGMEISAQTFRELTDNLDFKQRVMSMIANNNRSGLLPDTDFDCQGTFVKNVLEINHFRCRAILPSGRILDADENVAIKIPYLYGDKYYLSVSFGNEEVQFDKEEVTFVRPQYVYELHTMDEMENLDCIPVMKFDVKDGMFAISGSFIPPTLLLKTAPRFENYIESIAEKMGLLTDHANLEEGEGKRSLLRYLFMLKSYDRQASTHDFMQFVQEMANAVDYHIMRPNTENAPEVPQCSRFDVEEWLSWFEDYLNGAKTVLDGVVLEDHSIDYEKLKEEIKAEVYARVYPELLEQLRKAIMEEIIPDVQEQLKEFLTNYINGVLRQELKDDLLEELNPLLYDKLYKALYDALFNALYVPVEEEKEEEKDFVPQI